MYTWHDPNSGFYPQKHINLRGEKKRIERRGKERGGEETIENKERRWDDMRK